MKIMHIAAALAALIFYCAYPAYAWDSSSDGGFDTGSVQDLMAQTVKAMNAGNYDEAIRTIERASQADPFNESVKKMAAKAYKARGWARYNKGNFEDGIVDFKRANAFESEKNYETYLGLGYGSYRLQNSDDALYYLYDAAYINPDDPNVHEILGSIYYQRGKLADAINEWETVLKLKPDENSIKEMLAKAKKEYKVEGSFRRTETYYFNIKYEGEEKRELGDMVLDILDDAYRDVGGDLDYFPSEPVTVVLYTKKQFSDITDAPSWSGGVFDGTIRVPVGGEVDKTVLSAVLYHEYTHAVVAMIADKGAVPTWLNEGIAQYEERWIKEHNNNINRSEALPLHSLEGSFVGISDPGRARLAYIESLSAVKFFVDRFGSYNLKKLIELLGEGKSLPDSIRECTGISYKDFERYWLESLPG
jgi:Peptidase MA superfamily/Tetratricopeptide repeat